MISSINGYDFFGLSTDPKPTTPAEAGHLRLVNGSTLLEMDTSKVFIFDASSATWIELGGDS